jgi:ribosomal protein L29
LQRKERFQERYPDSMDEKRKSEAIAAARREIARRIARFCTTLSEEELNRLLDRMAYVQWKYDVAPIVPDLPSIKQRNGELPD